MFGKFPESFSEPQSAEITSSGDVLVFIEDGGVVLTQSPLIGSQV